MLQIALHADYDDRKLISTHSMAESVSSRRIFFSATRLATPLARRPTIVEICSLLQDTTRNRQSRHTISQRPMPAHCRNAWLCDCHMLELPAFVQGETCSCLLTPPQQSGFPGHVPTALFQ